MGHLGLLGTALAHVSSAVKFGPVETEAWHCLQKLLRQRSFLCTLISFLCQFCLKRYLEGLCLSFALQYLAFSYLLSSK